MAGSVIEIVPFDEAQGRAAAVAFDRYGKDFHANVAQRARHNCGAPEGSQTC
jgi:hypothetical protein